MFCTIFQWTMTIFVLWTVTSSSVVQLDLRTELDMKKTKRVLMDVSDTLKEWVGIAKMVYQQGGVESLVNSFRFSGDSHTGDKGGKRHKWSAKRDAETPAKEDKKEDSTPPHLGSFIHAVAKVLLKRGHSTQRVFAELVEAMTPVVEEQNFNNGYFYQELIEHLRRTASVMLRTPYKVVRASLRHYVRHYNNRTAAFKPETNDLLDDINSMYTEEELTRVQQIGADFNSSLKSIPGIVDDIKTYAILNPYKRMSDSRKAKFTDNIAQLIDMTMLPSPALLLRDTASRKRRRSHGIPSMTTSL